MSMRLCKDCKYFKPTSSDQLANGYCTHRNAITLISYHTGDVYYKMASEMRRKSKECGKSARFYIDKNDIEPIQYTCNAFCTDCKYQKPNTMYYNVHEQTEYALCTHPFATTVDMVSGEELYKYAYMMRNYAKPGDIKSCDVQGYLFEERDKSSTTKRAAGDDVVTLIRKLQRQCISILVLMMIFFFLIFIL